jgi:hypothetical protein
LLAAKQDSQQLAKRLGQVLRVIHVVVELVDGHYQDGALGEVPTLELPIEGGRTWLWQRASNLVGNKMIWIRVDVWDKVVVVLGLKGSSQANFGSNDAVGVAAVQGGRIDWMEAIVH